MKLMNTSDTELTLIRALLYGDSGIGKTTSLGTLPVNKTLIATAERGVLPLRNQNYPVLRFEGWNDVQTIYKTLVEPPTDDQSLSDVIARTRIVAVDSLSALSELCMQDIIQVARPALHKERAKKKIDKPVGVYEDLMTMEDWGVYKKRMLNLISAFCHLPYHVIFTSLAGWSKDKQGGDVYRTPNLSGKAAIECPAYFDLVLHMESVTDAEGKNQRVWRTANDGQIIAKDASGILNEFEPANWTKLFGKILGTKGKAKK